MVNYSDKTLDKKEKQILSKYKLIKFIDDIKIEKIEDIFKNLYITPQTTYYLDNTFHCEFYRGRSYYDCFLLCKYYFPEITFKEMYKKLYNLISTQNIYHNSAYKSSINNGPRFFTCSKIGKARFIGKLKLE